MKKGTLTVLALFAATLSSFGCKRPAPDGADPELTVAAAADLSGAFTDIAKLFERRTGSRVTLSFGSSGNLTKQIENGAPFDVFAAANTRFIDELDQRGLVSAGTREVYAQGRITIWQRKDSRPAAAGLADLAGPAIERVAIANPDHAPYGAAAVEALRNSGVYEKVKPKLVLAENIVQARQFAETGNADAAIVALSISDRPDGRWTVIDAALHQPIRQAVCVVRGARNEELAKRFVDFLREPDGQAVLKRYGFTVPD